MKKLAFSLIVATAGMMAISANAMSPKTVQYTCQGGKSVNVKYIFNDADLPSKAVASFSGKLNFWLWWLYHDCRLYRCQELQSSRYCSHHRPKEQNFVQKLQPKIIFLLPK